MFTLAQILVSVLVVDVIVIFLVRYFPGFFGKPINEWYDRFGLNAVIADVLVIVLGILIAQHTLQYTGIKAALPLFLVLVVAIQLVHDLLFYVCVIQPIPKGHNEMIDVFKTYTEGGGVKILAADAAMIAGSVLLATGLQAAPASVTAFTGILAAYTVPYILSTRAV